VPDSAEGAQSLIARGANPQAHHGPLQRLLDGMVVSDEECCEALGADWEESGKFRLVKVALHWNAQLRDQAKAVNAV
jgi:hypothetical protein